MGSHPVALVARREIRERVRTRGFQVATGLMLVGVLVIVMITAINSDDGPRTANVIAIGAPAEAALESIAGDHSEFDLEIKAGELPPGSGDQEARIRNTIIEGDADAALTESGILVTADDPPEALLPLLSRAAAEAGLSAKLQAGGLDRAQVEDALAATQVPITEVADPDTEEGASGIAFLATLLMYLAILSAGYTVSSGVVEEKTSRVVELILNAVRPSQLLAGKVLGIGLVSLGQFGLVVAVGLGGALVVGSVALPDATLSTALIAFVYFLLGYIFYACAFATAGAIVSRQEDSQNTTAPMMMLLVAGYILSFSVIDNPESVLAQVLSYLPPVAPMIVPVRIANDAMPPEQLALSLLAMIAGCLLLTWAAGRIYERAILRMGAPIKFREALALVRR